MYLCAGLHVLWPVSLLADLVAVVGVPAAVVLGLLQTVATLWGQWGKGGEGRGGEWRGREMEGSLDQIHTSIACL